MPPTPVRKREYIGSLPRWQRNSPMTLRQRGIIFCRSIRRCTRKTATSFSDLLQYKRESFWEQHRIIRFDTLTAQAEYTVMAVFQGEAEDLFAYYQFANAETPQEFAAYVDACKGVALYETGVSAAYAMQFFTL